MTPEDIAKGLPDEDTFGGTRVVDIIKHNHDFGFDLLQKLFNQLKADPQLHAHVLSSRVFNSDDDLIVVYKSDVGPLSQEEIMQDLREYLGWD